MSNIITCADWTWGEDYLTAWAPTNDPRVMALIRTDDDASFERCLDGDAIQPTFMIDRDRVEHIGGYEVDEDIAQRIVEARDRFRYAAGYRYNGLTAHHIEKAERMLERWLWINYETTAHRGNYGDHGCYDIVVLDTPAYREHVGIEETTREESQARADGMVEELTAIADGYVFGIGYLIFEERVTDDEEPEIFMFDETIECWGFVGEDYAKKSAAAFEAGAPTLPELLTFPKAS